MTRHGRHFWLGVLTAFVVAIAAGTARAEQIQCQLHSIRATTSGAQISPVLEPFRNFLLRPPLSSFTSFELIGTRTVTLRQGANQPISLDHGIAGQITFASSQGTQRVLNLSLRHQNRNLVNTTFRVSQGYPMFVVAGSVIPQGTLILGIVCR
jgi:hypothetical protein